MDWRREDYGYAAAAIAAAAFVAYLVAGNFALVPSPLSPADLASGPEPQVAGVSVIEENAAPQSGPIPAVAPTPAPIAVPRVVTPPSVAVAAPSVGFTTENGAEITLVEAATVRGTASDPDGIEKVLVTFTRPNGEATIVPAVVTCDATGLCGWTAEIPAVAASYQVFAQAYDAMGNAAQSSPINVTALNVGGPVSDVLGVVGRVPTVVGGLLDSVLNLLGLNG